MKKPNFLKIYGNELDAAICEGYYDGRRISSPDPDHNMHPAYIHGFLNGRDDLSRKPRKTASEIRADIQYIESVFKE